MRNQSAKMALAAAALTLCGATHALAAPEFDVVHVGQPASASDPGLPGGQGSGLPGAQGSSEIRVDWQDGKWTSVHDGELSLVVEYSVTMKKGYVFWIKFGTGERDNRLGTQIGTTISFWNPSGDKNLPASAAAHRTLNEPSTTDFFNSKQQKMIVAACNENANAANDFTASFDLGIVMRVRARRYKNQIDTWGPLSTEGLGPAAETGVTTLLMLKIACDPPEQNVNPPRAANKLHSVDFKVTQNGERCPKDVTVTAFANYTWPANSRMRLSVDGGVPKFRIAKTHQVTFAGKSWHRAEAEFKYKLDPGQKTFKLTVDGGEQTHTETIEIECPNFKILSAWLTYEVANTNTCPKQVVERATFYTTRPGWVKHEIKHQGGLVVSQGKLTAKREGDNYVATAVRTLTMNEIDAQFMADVVGDPANSGWVPLKVECPKLAGDFSFVDESGTQCPREGKALINFSLNMQANVHWSLDCSNGQHLSGVAQAVEGPNGYVAPALASFDITKTSVYSCALKTVAPGAAKVHQWKSHTFRCVTPAVATGSDDLQVAPKPNADAARNPRVPATLVPTAPDKPAADALKRRVEAAKKAAEDAKQKAEAEKRRRAEAAAAAKRKLDAAAAAAKKRKTDAAAAAAKKRKADADAAVAKKRKAADSAVKSRVMRLR
jgi:hypothetical protein